MKCIFFLFIILVFFDLNAQWERNLELPAEGWYRDICFLDENTGFLLTRNTNITPTPNPKMSYILKTIDSGQNWDTIYSVVDTNLIAIDFPTPTTGYIAIQITSQGSAILKSVDGGNSWQYESFIVVGSILTMDIEFYDENIGIFSAQAYSAITYDGGTTWSQISTNSLGGSQYTFQKDSLHAGVGGKLLYSTTDTAQTYNIDTVEWGGSARGVVLQNDYFFIIALGGQGGSFGYPYFNFGIISKYNPDTETLDITHFPWQEPVSIAATENYLYAGGYDYQGWDKRILKSTDVGQTWWSQLFNEPQNPSFSLIDQVYCINDTLCFASSGNILYKTINGGGPLIEQVGIDYSNVEENQIGNDDIQIYPNPATDMVHIQSTQKINKIQVVDLSGKELISNTEDDSKINISHLNAGVYLMILYTKKGKVVRKLIKK